MAARPSSTASTFNGTIIETDTDAYCLTRTRAEGPAKAGWHVTVFSCSACSLSALSCPCLPWAHHEVAFQ